MDPNETLRLILASKTRAEAVEHCGNLANWLARGGFAPRHPDKYWPGTGTQYAILSPASDNGGKWEFVHYARFRGAVVARWELS